jgi:serine protease
MRPILLAALLALSACPRAEQPPPATLARSTFQVDATVVPTIAQLEGHHVSALTDRSGLTADFIQRQLVVTSTDPAAVEALAARWGGRVLEHVSAQNARLGAMPDAFLLEVDPTKASVAELAEQTNRLNPTARGDFRFSDEDGLKLVAVAAAENVGGVTVILNFVPKDSGLEAPTAGALTSADSPSYSEAWDPDATHWSYFKTGGDQDTGVTAAWSMLEATHRLGNKVTIAIFDGGLLSHADVPPSPLWVSAPGTPNPAKCVGPTGSAPCPWHGTGVAAAAMAVPNNGFGVAGPAGPVAKPIFVPSPHDVWSFVKYVLVDLPTISVLQPKVLNFSFALRVPEGLNWVANPPIDLLFTAVRKVWGTLVIAAAGNENQDIDETDDLGAFKVATWIPCQSSNVLCVASLRVGSNRRAATYSNWANTSTHASHANSIDLYAPGTVWVPEVTEGGQVLNSARAASGTSYAAPFVAGVAALVWAADPGLSADQVEALLLSTAHTGSPDSFVNRWVNAAAAVKAVLRTAPPVVTITPPPDLTIDFDQNSLFGVPLNAAAVDGNGVPCCQVEWTSDVDGALGTGPSLSVVFKTPGVRTITASSTNSNGTGRATLQLTVVNASPLAVIVTPAENQVVPPAQSFQLEAQTALSTKTLTYRWLISGPDGKVLGPFSTPMFSTKLNLVGDYTMQLEVFDTLGGKGVSALRHFRVAASTVFEVTTIRLNLVVAPSYIFSVGQSISYSGDYSGAVGAAGAQWIWQGNGPGCPAVTMSYAWFGNFLSWAKDVPSCIDDGVTGTLTLTATDEAQQVAKPRSVTVSLPAMPK